VAITRGEEIKQLGAQADTLQRRLWMLEQQIAGYGALAVLQAQDERQQGTSRSSVCAFSARSAEKAQICRRPKTPTA
jgi:hypothetical protein